MKISEVREHELYTSSSLLIILINLLALIFFYADLGPNFSKFRRDALLIIFMLLGSVGFILFVSTYSIFVLVTIVIPSLIAMWFLSSPLITSWIYGTISDREVYENFLNDKKIQPRIQAFSEHLVLTFLCLLIVIPVFWIIDTSFSPGNSLSSSEGFRVGDWTTEHFSNILSSDEFYTWVKNSLIVSIGTTILGLSIAIPAGYGFSRYQFYGKSMIMFSFILVQMFPGVIIIVPYFILMKTLGLLNTSAGLILAYSVTALPLCVWMLKGYFDTIPRELEEAARIDGCSQFQVFWKIIIPLSLPAIAVTSLFSFLAAWNEFLLALTFNTSNANYTLPVGLASFISPTKQLWGDFAALSIIAAIPIVLLFILFQKYLINGLTAGSVKG
jgi:arabinogalactan oligomer/maltooligosaccharide transport system permease protein